MNWFGSEPFGPVCQHAGKVETPVGAPCDWCEEVIVSGDAGLLVPSVGTPAVFHRPCFLRQVVGSVAHQNRQCSCFGKDNADEDPPGMTRRQAAEAATALFESNLLKARWERGMRVKCRKVEAYGTIFGPVEKGGVWLFWDLNPHLSWTESESIEPLRDESGRIVFSDRMPRGPMGPAMTLGEWSSSHG